MKSSTILLVAAAGALAFVAFRMTRGTLGAPAPSVPTPRPSQRERIENYGIGAAERVADGLVGSALDWISGSRGDSATTGARSDAGGGSIADFAYLDF